MIATTKPFLAMTASDLMSRDVVMIPRAMSLRTAGHLLSETHVSGAPVVDDTGECVGVLSSTDFMHWVGNGEQGACRPSCPKPGCFHTAWQIAEGDDLPTDEVGAYMTTDPVTVPPNTPIANLARKMIDAHIHRIIVVNEENQTIGVVSSTDILAALAYAER